MLSTIEKNCENYREQIKLLEGRIFELTELEPNYNHNCVKIHIKANNDNFQMINDENGKVLKTINYEDIKDLNIDNILVGLKLKNCPNSTRNDVENVDNEIIYFLKQQRNDLVEILKDFSKDIMIDNTETNEMICMNNFKVKMIENEHKIILIGREYNIELEEETDRIVSFNIDLDRILRLEEDYIGNCDNGSNDRNVKVELTDNEYITLESI